MRNLIIKGVKAAQGSIGTIVGRLPKNTIIQFTTKGDDIHITLYKNTKSYNGRNISQKTFKPNDIDGIIRFAKNYILSKTQDSGSRVFDRLFKVLDSVKGQDERQTENKFKAYAWYIYYYFYYKGKKSEIEKSIALGLNKDDALKDFKRSHPFHPSQKMTIVKVELAPKTLKPIQSTLRQNKKMEQIRSKKIGDEVKRFVVPKININTLSYLLMEFLDSNKKSETQKFGTNKGFSYTLTFQRLSENDMRVIYTANKQSFSMVLKDINITNKVRFAEKIAQKINAINSLKGV